ncbi:hypothetical protein [Paraclostridium bifermentans]|uniref:hypothetical protein n=1 Tax=Paraclostridium bifermentans TaxID=1490 RepID=UPI00038C7544|nr:hypothetical protein [Paraclostridium bifermentans]EQK41496.1 hypothetical protein C671_2704 [[Clostridium] bifermentans ATCC 19299] [Paraclostridium bifermentans ATCC 19299]TQO55595.1 hypothetical protein D5S05_17430 [Paraclostridium bifermentans]
MEILTNKYNIQYDESLTFIVSKDTYNEFKELIYFIKNLNVNLDFNIDYSDYLSINDSGSKDFFKLIHVTNNSYNEDISTLLNVNDLYIKRKSISVDLSCNPDIFDIFLAIKREGMSSIIYNFFDTGVSFFISNKQLENIYIDIEEVEKF